ncbi:hypothetical protein, partial [Actinacidiphila rubida]
AARKTPSWSVPGALDRDALEVGALEADPSAAPSDPGATGAADPSGMADVTGLHGGDAAGNDTHRFV